MQDLPGHAPNRHAQKLRESSRSRGRRPVQVSSRNSCKWAERPNHLALGHVEIVDLGRGGREGVKAGFQSSDGLLAVAHALVGERERRLVDQNSASWNQIAVWLRGIDELRRAA
jgi:hypothetical protein